MKKNLFKKVSVLAIITAASFALNGCAVRVVKKLVDQNNQSSSSTQNSSSQNSNFSKQQ